MKEERPLRRFLMKTAAIIILAAVSFLFILNVHVQSGNDLEPYIQDGDLLIAFRAGGYHAGDAVLYRDPLTGKTIIAQLSAIRSDQAELAAYRGVNPETPETKAVSKKDLRGKLVFLFRRRGL